ncbi:MAG: hypothetical protein AAF602_22085, partial [Myxococcota bacterium]
MMQWILWLSVALAGGDTARSTWARFASIANLEIEPTMVRPLEAPLTITEGPVTYELEGGWMVPVFGGRPSST